MRFAVFLASCLYLSGTLVSAQDWRMPDDITLNTADDYANYRDDVLACIKWLEETPQNTKKEERQMANAFLLMWLTGTPDVTIEVNGEVLPFMASEDHGELLLTFMGGWTMYALTDSNGKDKVQGNVHGLRRVIHVYSNVGGVKKHKELDKLVKLEKSGKLEDWVREKLQG